MTGPPVLLVVFNRPDTTRRVLHALSSWDIERLYVAADGPRPQQPDDAGLCERTRRVVTGARLPFPVEARFHDENHGVARTMPEALNWFFEHEEAGIVLEDDTLPSQAFGRFAAQLLERFRDVEEIGLVSGTCHYPPSGHHTGLGYRFTSYPHIWGWATWRRAWEAYDPEMAVLGTPDLDRVLRWGTTGRSSAVRFWAREFELTARGIIDTWAYRWLLSRWERRLLGVQPTRNLVENIGFGAAATHTVRRPAYLQPVWDGDGCVTSHPSGMYRDRPQELWTERHVFGITWRHSLRRGLRSVARHLRDPAQWTLGNS